MACGSYGFSLIEIGKTCIVINKYLSSTYKCNFLGADNKQ